MPKNPPEDMPRITPYLQYEDVAAAMDWLARVFGFRERMRLAGPDQFHGDRRYAAEDPEGHVWYFAQRVRDVAPEDMKLPARPS